MADANFQTFHLYLPWQVMQARLPQGIPAGDLLSWAPLVLFLVESKLFFSVMTVRLDGTSSQVLLSGPQLLTTTGSMF